MTRVVAPLIRAAVAVFGADLRARLATGAADLVHRKPGRLRGPTQRPAGSSHIQVCSDAHGVDAPMGISVVAVLRRKGRLANDAPVSICCIRCCRLAIVAALERSCRATSSTPEMGTPR